MRGHRLSRRGSGFVVLPAMSFYFGRLVRGGRMEGNVLSTLLKGGPRRLRSARLLPAVLRPRCRSRGLKVLSMEILFTSKARASLRVRMMRFSF